MPRSFSVDPSNSHVYHPATDGSGATGVQASCMPPPCNSLFTTFMSIRRKDQERYQLAREMSPLEMARLGLRPVRILFNFYRLQGYRVQYVAGWLDWLRGLGGWQLSVDGWTPVLPSWASWTGLAPPVVPHIIARK